MHPNKWTTSLSVFKIGQLLHWSNLWLFSTVEGSYNSSLQPFICSILKYSLSPTSAVGIIYISPGCLFLPIPPLLLPSLLFFPSLFHLLSLWWFTSQTSIYPPLTNWVIMLHHPLIPSQPPLPFTCLPSLSSPPPHPSLHLLPQPWQLTYEAPCQSERWSLP